MSRLRALVTSLLALALLTTPLAAVPASAQPEDPPPPRGRLALDVTPATISPTGTVTLAVNGTLAAPASDMEVRFRILRTNGKLVFQRTIDKSDLKAGAVSVSVSKSFAGIRLREGRYIADALVTGTGLKATLLTGRMYVVKPTRTPVQVVIVPRFQFTPSTDPEGRFLIDPATTTRSRDDVMALASMLDRHPELRLSLGITPLMLDDWRRILDGYSVTDPGGAVRAVGKQDPVVGTYRTATQALRRMAHGSQAELLDVPFADPDLAGLKAMGALTDLDDHFARSASVYQASLNTTPTTGVAVHGDVIPSAAGGQISRNHATWVLVDPTSVQSKAPTATPGVYALSRMRMRALVLDQTAGKLLESRGGPVEPVVDHLMTRLMSTTSASQPLVIPIRFGPGATTDPARLEATLAELAKTGWVRFRKASEIATTKPAATVTLKDSPGPGSPAPGGYWQDVERAATDAHAFLAAVSERDADADGALYQALVSESHAWAGADGSWSLADRGRAFAAASERSSRGVIGKVSVTSSDITLSGTSGNVPIVVKNESSKSLQVQVVPSATGVSFRGAPLKTTLRPGDNYVTIPVDLERGGLYARVTVNVNAGSVTLASTDMGVTASYLDRIAVVATVALVLLGLLFYIRRKVRRADADRT